LVLAGSVILLGAGVVRGDDRAQAELLDSFAELDRAYVPALALTKMGTAEASDKALGKLKRQWRAFNAKYANAVPNDAGWKKDFASVGEAISEAAEHLANGQQLEAHESLEAIREILLEARRRNDMDYYLDRLTEFHTTMEEIVLAVKVEQPSDLTPDEINKIRQLAGKAVEQWDDVKSTPFPSQRFGFHEEKLAKRKQLLQAETMALEKLERALAANDKAEIVATGMAIKPIFAQSFMLFGTFPNPANQPAAKQ
jgi:hypothetical protein